MEGADGPTSLRELGRQDPRLEGDPDILGRHPNPAVSYIWQLVRDPALTRSGGGGMGPCFLTQQDIAAFCAAMQHALAPEFIRALILADRAILDVWRQETEGDDG